MKTYTIYLTKDTKHIVIADGFEKSEDTIYFYQEKMYKDRDSEQKVVALFNFSNIYGFALDEIELSRINTELIPS